MYGEVAGRVVDQLTQHDPRRIGPFEVLGRLGAGGMGLVYLARSASGRRVAIKTVRLRKRGLLHRIRREVLALARIRHPGLVRIIETGQSEGLPWYAMELLRGTTLHDELRKAGPSARGAGIGAPRPQGQDTRDDFVRDRDDVDMRRRVS